MENVALFLIKPDAFRRGLEGVIYKEIRNCGLSIVGKKTLQLNEQMIRAYQPVLNEPSEFGEGWKKEAIEAMTSGLVEVLMVTGKGALEKSREIKKRVRSRFSPGQHYRDRVIFNLVHTADNILELTQNIEVLIPEWLPA